MNREETKAFLKTVVSIFPNFQITDHSVSAWQMCFADKDPQVCLAALKAHAIDSKWPPTVAELNAIIEQARRPKGSDWTAAEALHYIQNLASRYRSMTDEEKQIERMNCPKLTKDALRLVGFDRFLPSVPQAYNPWGEAQKKQQDPSGLFIKIYEQIQNREIDLRRLERLSEPEQKLLGKVTAALPELNKLLN